MWCTPRSSPTNMQLRNRNPIVAGGTPLSYMIDGGAPAMQKVRRLLEAQRQGQ